MSVFTAVDVRVTDDVLLGVIDGYVAVNRLVFLDIVVDIVLIRTENDASIAVVSNGFVNILEILTDQKANSSVGATDECHDWRFVVLEGTASLFVSPRSRGLSSSFLVPFSPAVT